VRTDTIIRVADAFGTGSRSIRDVAHKTGLSYNSVKNALPHLQAEKVEGTSPVLWHLPKKDRTRVGKEAGVPTYTVDIVEHDDWPGRWNNARELYGKQVGKIEIDPRADPKELLDQLRRATTSLASVTAALEGVADMPDWFTLLGGTLESDEETK